MSVKDPNFERLFNDVAQWQDKTFPGQTIEQKITHLKKELVELAQAPRDASEQADVLILVVGIFATCGAKSPRDVLAAAHAKHEINKLRRWIAQDDGTWAHDKEYSV